ncbi:type II toxin-antitoxin system HipA family toxin [Cellvibrio sp. UBA7661]|uniref:type II toxin-antitoxin system HipA family toxin n=1 Tax=Cellvibrio sp. UBA7661 TaxID=1946311 RepID=UPI002F35E519
MSSNDEVRVLQLSLHDVPVGYLAGFRSGRNLFRFDANFKANLDRPTLSLITHPAFPNVDKVLDKSWLTNQRLHPIFSNLLPEGVLRELLAQGLKTHIDHEFELLAHLGHDLPGALVASPVEPDNIPAGIFSDYKNAKPVSAINTSGAQHFSLAGVQMKFSMKEKEGRYQLATRGDLGDWIIKTPSTKHPFVPLNEYSAMRLAELVGISIPEIKLVPLSQLDKLPHINLPNEDYAFAIRRFDRHADGCVHMEDFAQVLVKYPHEKYSAANYEQIGKIIYRYSGDALANAQQFARRLLVNILLANGDAHLKNWSLFYPDKITPELSPAYDLVTTNVYIENETQFALNLGGTKEWYKVTYTHFQHWAEKADIPWRAIKPHLDDVMASARELWPDALKGLPMIPTHKTKLLAHWKNLQKDFRIII